jgi:ABC-type dipeptide/oligopeptide/nickel transport system permease subunit
MTRTGNSNGTARATRPWVEWAVRALLLAWVGLLITVIAAGWSTHATRPALPVGVERAPENAGIYHGWISNPHPLGFAQELGDDKLELLLLGLSRTLTGPLLVCAVAVMLGGLWGTWAAYSEGIGERLLRVAALFLEAIPRIVLFALLMWVVRVPGLHLDIMKVTVIFAFFQIPAVGIALCNHVRSLVREGYVEGLISLGFSRHTIVLRDLLWRECGPLLRLQYVARVTELIALETAVSYALGGSEQTVGGVLRRLDSGKDQGIYPFLVIGSLALYLVTLSALSRRAWVLGPSEPAAARQERVVL